MQLVWRGEKAFEAGSAGVAVKSGEAPAWPAPEGADVEMLQEQRGLKRDRDPQAEEEALMEEELARAQREVQLLDFCEDLLAPLNCN